VIIRRISARVGEWGVGAFDRFAAWVVGLLLVANAGKWLGGEMVRSGPQGIVIAAGVACAVWVVFLAWHSSNGTEPQTEAHKFLRHLITAAVVGFLLFALGLR
jgi:hypothetical protein